MKAYFIEQPFNNWFWICKETAKHFMKVTASTDTATEMNVTKVKL